MMMYGVRSCATLFLLAGCVGNSVEFASEDVGDICVTAWDDESIVVRASIDCLSASAFEVDYTCSAVFDDSGVEVSTSLEGLRERWGLLGGCRQHLAECSAEGSVGVDTVVAYSDGEVVLSDDFVEGERRCISGGVASILAR